MLLVFSVGKKRIQEKSQDIQKYPGLFCVMKRYCRKQYLFFARRQQAVCECLYTHTMTARECEKFASVFLITYPQNGKRQTKRQQNVPE